MRTRETLNLLLLGCALLPIAAAGNLHDEREEEHPPSEEGLPGWVVPAAAGGIVLSVAAASFPWWLRPLRRAVVLSPFFARLTRRDVTEHPLRARILDAVEARPGISAAELAEQEDANSGTLDYHLDVLERDGHLRTAKAGRNRLLFRSNTPVDVEAVAQVSAQGRGDVARLVLAEPGLHASAIASRLGLKRATVHHHLAQLESGGLVRVDRGLRAFCFPTERLAGALEPARRRRLAILFDQDQKNA